MTKNSHQNHKIVDDLQNLLKKAYAPYSNVFVSAIVITNDNKKYSGVNIENASFSPSICAERCAIFKAIFEGQKNAISELHLMSSTIKPLYPCGVCLQVMSEFFNPKTEIFIYDFKGKLFDVKSLESLLPFRITKASF